MQAWKKWLSGILLLAAAGVLVFIATKKVMSRFSVGMVTLEAVPFGLSTDTRIPIGRATNFSDRIQSLDETTTRLYARSLDYRREGEINQALANLEALIRSKPDFLPGYTEAAILRQNRWDASRNDSLEALQLHKQALEIDASNPVVHFAYGQYLWRCNKRDDAVQQFRLAIDVSPQYAEPYVYLGKYYLQKGDLKQADHFFRTAISLYKGRNPAPYDLLAIILYKQGKDEDALTAVDLARTEGKQSNELELVRGYLFEAQGSLKRAESQYKQLIEKYPLNREYRQALETLGRKPSRVEIKKITKHVTVTPVAKAAAAAALAALKPVLESDRQNGSLWMAVGKAYSQGGEYDSALASFDSAFRFSPTLSGLPEAKAQALHAKSSSEEMGITAATLTQNGMNSALGMHSSKEDSNVIIPGRQGYLGTFNLAWGSYRIEAIQMYPKFFSQLANGNLLRMFVDDQGLKQEIILAYKDDKLWGVRVIITDTNKAPRDIFGYVLKEKTKISGEGKATGQAKCEGFKRMQGLIWENEDTFEFMAQFDGSENQIRLARVGMQYLPSDKRLCNLAAYLDTKVWSGEEAGALLNSSVQANP